MRIEKFTNILSYLTIIACMSMIISTFLLLILKVISTISNFDSCGISRISRFHRLSNGHKFNSLHRGHSYRHRLDSQSAPKKGGVAVRE